MRLIEIFEVREHSLDSTADPIVISDELQSSNLAIWQSRMRNASQDGRLGSQMFRGGPQLAHRCMHHRHRILDGDGLRPGRLNILFGTAEAWKDE